MEEDRLLRRRGKEEHLSGRKDRFRMSAAAVKEVLETMFEAADEDKVISICKD